MKALKLLTFFLFLCFTVYQCIDPITQELGRPPDILVVEGFIDDDFGPHEIEVSLIANFASVSDGGGKRRVDANVRIFDDLGNSVPLRRETLVLDEIFNAQPPTLGNGSRCVPQVTTKEVTTNYLTPSTFRGVAGRSYALEVVLENGDTYRSNLQELPQAPEIDSVIVDFAIKPGENDLVPVTGLDVFVLWQDDPTSDNFHFWDMDGTYSIQTPDRTDGTICCLFDPRRGRGSTTGESCWVIERNLPGVRRAFDDRLVSSDQTAEFIGFVEDDGRRFSSLEVPGNRQYHLEVHQYSMSEQAFNFFNNVDILSEIDGEIFDPPPIGARGNVVNITNPNEQVVGFFGVFGKKSKGIFVPRSLFPEIKQHSICGDCRQFANGQLETPEVYR